MSRVLQKVRRMRLAVSLLMILVCDVSFGAAPQERLPAAIDVALTSQGNLVSRCEDAMAQSIGAAVVELYQDQRLIHSTTSREDGWFIFRDVPSGVYEMQSRDWRQTIRVWTRDAAPPVALEPVVLILHSESGQPVSTGSESATIGASVPDGTSEVSEESEVLQLAYDDGAVRRGSEQQRGVVRIVNDTAPEGTSTVEQPAAEVPAVEPDLAFDPFAPATTLTQAPLDELQFPDSIDEPIGPNQSTPAESTADIEAAPEAAPMPNPPPPYFYPRRNVGPTVGDVVLTSVGIAGITMGVIGIHKYESSRVRRSVSP